MLRSRRLYIYLSCLAALLSGCVEGEDTDQLSNDAQPVVADLAFAVSMPDVGLTRLGSDVVQVSPTDFRGISEAYLIPLYADGTPTVYMSIGNETNPRTGIYYFEHCSFMSGTKSVLFYGRATPKEGGKAVNGSLVTSFPGKPNPAGLTVTSGMNPNNIVFKPERIRESNDVPEEAQRIADYLTSIATTDGWRGTTGMLGELYENFIGQNGQSISMFSGAYSSIIAHVGKLKSNLQALSLADGSAGALLRTAILEKANAEPDDLDHDYPASLRLPDGAAVLRWSPNDYKFVPLTERSTIADINAVNRYAYPAELYYFTNSPLLTTTDDVDRSFFERTEWKLTDDDLYKYYSQSLVTADTRAVVLKDQVQYGVACLKVVLKGAKSNTLLDSQNKPIAISGKGFEAFPLTGIIVNGQREVDHNFKPFAETDDNDYFVYDSQLQKEEVYLQTAEQKPVYTLLLQSPPSLKINILLEFRNNSGQDFYGKDGIIYNGMKFYLIGTVDPTVKDTNDNSRAQAFTQDEYTTLNMTVESLANAYNVMPNLLSPRLEIGILIDPEWTPITPTNVEFY